jgi:hypothetical protein
MTVDPIFPLLAAELRAWDEQVGIQTKADRLFFAARKANPEPARTDKCRLPGEIGELDRQSDAAVEKAAEFDAAGVGEEAAHPWRGDRAA